MRLPLQGAALVVGLVVGSAAGYLPDAVLASRNSSGTYSLPAGNPVVTGNTITSTWANTTLSDISTELTNSLDRGGRGAMTAPLQLSNGTVSLPSLTFGSDTDSGLYRIGANNVGLAVNGTKLVDYSTSGIGVVGVATVGNGAVGAPSVSFTSDTDTGLYRIGADNPAIAVNGVKAQDWTTTRVNVALGLTVVEDSANGDGIISTGAGNGRGGVFTGGGSNSHGILATGGATNGNGVVGVGAGVGIGGVFHNGTDATGGTRQDAASLVNGDLDLSTVANPSSTTSISERLTPMNLVKAWGRMTSTGGGSTTITVNSGFNVTSAAVSNATLTVTIAADLAAGAGAVVVTPETNGQACSGSVATAGTLTVRCFDITTATAVDIQAAAALSLSFMLLGAQ